jgi:hypothetical protein
MIAGADLLKLEIQPCVADKPVPENKPPEIVKLT